MHAAQEQGTAPSAGHAEGMLRAPGAQWIMLQWGVQVEGAAVQDVNELKGQSIEAMPASCAAPGCGLPCTDHE